VAITDQMRALAARVRAEYREMPGLSLTAEQASRLLGIDRPVCEQVLQGLVSDGALYHTPRGAYVAATSARERV
jgi:DNA-binding GntR family transcriptional regulator